MKKSIIYFALAIALAFFAYRLSVNFNLNPQYSIGDILDQLDGVKVYYNGGVNNVVARNLTVDGYNLGLKYQCVEFVKRYYYEAYGHKMPDSYGHAKDFFNKKLNDGQFNKTRGLVQYRNPGKRIPKSGDILVYAATALNPYGHVAIVSHVDNDKGTVEIIQQNAGPFSPAREIYTLKRQHNSWYIEHRLIKGWLRLSNTITY